jgi:hypothetical protein
MDIEDGGELQVIDRDRRRRRRLRLGGLVAEPDAAEKAAQSSDLASFGVAQESTARVAVTSRTDPFLAVANWHVSYPHFTRVACVAGEAAKGTCVESNEGFWKDNETVGVASEGRWRTFEIEVDEPNASCSQFQRVEVIIVVFDVYAKTKASPTQQPR